MLLDRCDLIGAIRGETSSAQKSLSNAAAQRDLGVGSEGRR